MQQNGKADKTDEADGADEADETQAASFTYDEILQTEFSLVLPADYYAKNADTGEWEDMRYEDNYMTELVQNGVKLKIVGIVRPDEEATATSITGAIGYTHALTDYLVTETAKREIVKAQLAEPDVDIFTGLTFKDVEEKQALAERAKNAENKAKEKETTTAAAVSTGALHPTVGNLAAAGTPSVTPIDETKAMTEDEIRAYIEEKVPEEDRGSMLEFLDLFMKNTRTLRERKQMTDMLNQLLADYEVPGVGKITGEQAYSYILLMNREQKLAMLTAMITGDTSALEAELPADMVTQTQDEPTTGAANEQADEQSAETPNEPEPEPEPELPPEPQIEAAQNLAENKKILGVADPDDPDRINLYPVDFQAKEDLSAIIEDYNQSMRDADREEGVINYTDYIGIFLSSVTTIINVVSYVLIAFVAISLVVSSIMIGIITYISVLERTKEIGILRSIGASKRDISRVFNAETLIVGFAAGVIGIVATILLNIPANIVIKALVDISNVSRLPVGGAIALIIISVLLTVIAGLIPSRYAAKKDPVEALRTE
jgi:putative ABC transport system permease protein